MAEIPIPLTVDEATIPVVRSHLEEHGRVRLSEIRDDLDDDHTGRIGPALLELLEDGEVALFPVGDEVIIKPQE